MNTQPISFKFPTKKPARQKNTKKDEANAKARRVIESTIEKKRINNWDALSN